MWTREIQSSISTVHREWPHPDLVSYCCLSCRASIADRERIEDPKSTVEVVTKSGFESNFCIGD